VTGLILDAFGLVIIAIALDVLIGSIRAVVAGAFDVKRFIKFLQTGILYNVLPLFILLRIFPYDPTGILLKVIFYAGAIGVIVKYIIDIVAKLKRW